MLISIEVWADWSRWTQDRARLFFGYEMTVSPEIESMMKSLIGRPRCELVLATFRREQHGYVLRALIEKEGSDPDKGSGVDLKLCADISRELSATLDVDELIDKTYTLEVSSPGIERPLVKPNDYMRFIGRLVLIKTVRDSDGRRKFKWKLDALANEDVIIKAKKGKAFTIPLDMIDKANLVFEPKGFGANAGEG